MGLNHREESAVEIRDRLNELACNLYWTWHSEVYQIFQDLNPDLWRDLSRNPVAFLDRLSDEYLEERTNIMALKSRITRAYYTLRDYLEKEDTWGRQYVRSLRIRPVAYFSAEFGLHESLPIYSGGLGVLSGDHIKAASDLDVPLTGVGLLYAKGYFSQCLDINGWQQEHYFDADIKRLPLVAAADRDGKPLRIVLKTADDAIHVRAWTAKVGRCQLVLLDTNVEDNSEVNRGLTAQLYGGDQRVRVRQEYVLGIGGLRALHLMGIRPGVVHLNEGHSAFALLELARSLMERNGESFDNIRETAAGMSVFTTHTPVPAGHDRFDAGLIEETLGPFRKQIGLLPKEFMALGRTKPDDENESFCMTVLGLKMSRSRNAVSNLHRRVSKAMWGSIWPNKSQDEIPIGHITNGIHVGTWLAPDMDRLYRRWLGEDWQEQMHDPKTWESIDDMNDEELWEINEILRSHLVDFARDRVRWQRTARGEPDPTQDPNTPFLYETALTIGVARRFTPYKRADLLLRDPDRLDKVINNPGKQVQVIFAGKAHPRDEEGKKLIQRIFTVARDPRFAGRIVFIEDYDINVTRQLVQGVDLWLNTPRRPLEACGTSGMKAVLNGALNFSVLDGWWAEAYDGTNGFVIGDGGEHKEPHVQDQRDLDSLYDTLEREVVPMFYGRDEDDVPRAWIQRQKNAMRTLAWRFSSHRMVTEYVKNCYVSAAGGTTSTFCLTESPLRTENW
ncbi:MAG: alpha-glucan family phosphorylase [Candidatus Latescibacteria bacterium]|nr:alpha-glucan family phosphorylase [Candidatus Latescibacterota bacterium]NIM22419.1 alpha-glucan family phosphorylase [Candidatus Latescibacterota bacterium]NIM64779.1 alpha-glucan family phosphorylase [Candidatus Latescibacterota bacterium]NIO01290.1 alpha-glucan family phosphorylase [Candidatus Latescibacterota bacterium]NIO27782.1 alpha-glucan family phosphorylase [Candidatus Latescibacterota bacterium]